MNLHGPKRDAMNALDAHRKRYLLEQSKTASSTKSKSSQDPRAFVSLSSASGSSMTKMMPQLTGASTKSPPPASVSSWTKRLSIASLAAWTSTSSDQLGTEVPGIDGDKTPTMEKPQPLEAQTTGGLWGWWSGATEKGEGENDIAGFIYQIRG
jgi:hypothetical protein